MKVGLFHTGGHTEIGALTQFFERACPGVRFERRFPARDRRRPVGTPSSHPSTPERLPARLAPRGGDQGATGGDLHRRMLAILKEHDRSANYAAYLLVDDADCRFCVEGRAAYVRQRQAWARDVADALGRPTPLFVCLAFQEVEAWLLSDWENTFGIEYRQQDPALRRALGEALGSAALNAPEEIGCPQKSSGEGCTVKVSEEIQRVVASSSETLYSKAVHGQAMLRRLNADAVAQRCRQFREDLTTLREGLRALTTAEGAAHSLGR